MTIRPSSLPRKGAQIIAPGRLALYGILTLFAAIFILPFVWQLGGSLKTPAELATGSFSLFPAVPQWENYAEVFRRAPIATWFANSVVIAVLGTLGATLTSAFCAYGFAVLRARGSRLAFGMVLLTILVPYQVLIIPEYIVWAKLGLTNTPIPLVLPWFLGGGAFNIFLLRQFMLGLPRDMVDAARVDGASEFQIFRRVILPMCGPALAVVAVFHFIFMWNDFLRPLLYLQDPSATTLPVGLAGFVTRFARQWHLLLAGSAIALAPLVIIFALAQRVIARGISVAGVRK
jgi:multiple sugar transport system permease protein